MLALLDAQVAAKKIQRASFVVTSRFTGFCAGTDHVTQLGQGKYCKEQHPNQFEAAWLGSLRTTVGYDDLDHLGVTLMDDGPLSGCVVCSHVPVEDGCLGKWSNALYLKQAVLYCAFNSLLCCRIAYENMSNYYRLIDRILRASDYSVDLI